jgi:hypothetical protein
MATLSLLVDDGLALTRSPLLLGIGVLSGWATLSGVVLIFGSGLYDRSPAAPMALYIWTMNIGLPITALPHALRALRLR